MEAGAATGAFMVTRTGPTTTALIVSYTVGGTALAGSDYTALTGTVTIPVGAKTAVIIVTPIDDTLLEPAETVLVTLSADPAYVVGSATTATVTITDNDRPTVTIRASDSTASEAGLTTGKFTVTRRLNGDETHQGRHLRLPMGALGVQRVKVYSFR